MAGKPANLIYGVDDRPGLWTTLLLGLQHVLPMSSTLVLPVLIVAAVPGATSMDSQNFLRVSLLAGGLSSIFTAMRWGWFGSGYLCPSLCGPAYFSASIAAVTTGGLPLVLGMTMFSGLVKAVLAPLARWLRPLFPTEVTGLVVMMIGFALITSGITQFFGVGVGRPGEAVHAPVVVEGARIALPPTHADPGRPAQEVEAQAPPTESPIALRWPTLVTGLVTLSVMVSLNIWGKGALKLYSLLLGMGIGYLTSWILTYLTAVPLLTSTDLARISHQPVLAFPRLFYAVPVFSGALIIPFLIAALSSYIKAVGNITTCQQINDKDWKRPEMKSISGGLLANAAGTLTSGLFGGMSMETSTSNVGLSAATGATSRVIAYAAGGIFVAMAFLPQLAEAIIIMPPPVQGAMLIYVTTFMIVGGVQILTSRMLDARKIFIIGLAIIFGMAVDLKGIVYSGVPDTLKPLFESSLSLATAVVLVLNIVLRIGVSRKRTLKLVYGEDSPERITEFMTTAGGEWGARREVIAQAMTAMNEFYESAENWQLNSPEILMKVSFDEFNLDLEISYDGTPPVLPDSRPSKRELIEDETAGARLAGYMIRKSASRVKTLTSGGRQLLCLHYDH